MRIQVVQLIGGPADGKQLQVATTTNAIEIPVIFQNRAYVLEYRRVSIDRFEFSHRKESYGPY